MLGTAGRLVGHSFLDKDDDSGSVAELEERELRDIGVSRA
jgi:hypothetical protein